MLASLLLNGLSAVNRIFLEKDSVPINTHNFLRFCFSSDMLDNGYTLLASMARHLSKVALQQSESRVAQSILTSSARSGHLGHHINISTSFHL